MNNLKVWCARGAIGLWVAALAVSCQSTLPRVQGTVLDVARNMIGVAADNHAPNYANELEMLVAALVPDEEASTDDQGGGLELDVALLREVVVEGQAVPIPIQDGDVLKDGRGDPEGGDNLKISFRANRRCFLYVIAIDGSGWVQSVFPSALVEGNNPIEKGRDYVVPEGNEWFFLDEHRGIETFYFVASPERRLDIEEMMTRFDGKSRDSSLANPREIEEAAVLERGLGGTRTGRATTVQDHGGHSHEINPTTFLSELGARDLVITRWFRHQ